MFAHSKLHNICYQKKRERTKKKTLDVSVGRLYNNRGFDLKSLIKLIEAPRLLRKGEVDPKLINSDSKTTKLFP